MLSLVSAEETGDKNMKWLPNKAELLKRAKDNECQKTWKQRLAAWALVKARQEVGLEDGKCLKRWKEQHEQKYVDRNEHGVLQNMEESKSAVQKEEDSGSPGRHVQLKDCTQGAEPGRRTAGRRRGSMAGVELGEATRSQCFVCPC